MTAADQEVELKFVCAPDALGAILAAAPAGDEREAELISVYFDTPDQALRKAGVSLRVRESEGRRVQTLKRGEGMAREALAQIAANAQVQRAAPSPEAVHQLRVGARRFRSALSAFGKAVEDQGLPGVKAEIAWLSHACDEARNLDVFAESLIGDK